jgi:hypothetical protein
LFQKLESARSAKSSQNDLTKRVSVVDKPGQDKAHFTGLKSRTKKTTRKVGWIYRGRKMADCCSYKNLINLKALVLTAFLEELFAKRNSGITCCK